MDKLYVQLMPLLLSFGVFYFILNRPQQRRVKKHKALVSAVQPRNKVLNTEG